jgi:DNA-binding NtrC family response regulator
MSRPTFLLAEPEPVQALSARKLVLETAKFNVITAYTGRELLESLDRFPHIDAVILQSQVHDIPFDKALDEVKKWNPQTVTVLLGATASAVSKHADHIVSSHDPEELLFLLRRLFGDPREL